MSNRSYLSIGDVLTLLRAEFPDVTISKIRFLESQGLVNPERSPSGYRKFYDHDVERLRWVLRQQRENFLPLKVIRDRLAQDGADLVPATATASPSVPVPAAVAPSAAGAPAVNLRPASVTTLDPVVAGTHTTPAATVAAAHQPGENGLPSGGPATAAGMGIAGPQPPGARSLPAAPVASGDPESPRQGLAASPPGPSGPPATVTTASARPPAPAPASTPPVPPPPAAPTPPAAATAPAAPAPAAPASAAPASAAPAPAAPRRSETPQASPPADAVADAPAPGEPRAAVAGGAPAGGPPSATAPPSPAAPPSATDGVLGAAGRGANEASAGLTGMSLTLDELCAATGLPSTTVSSLEGFGLISPMVVGGIVSYDEDALMVARTVAEFARYGIEPRHLRLYRNAVDREAGLIEQVITPLLRQRNPESRQKAVNASSDLARLGQSLRASLLRRELRRQLGT